MIPFSYKTIAFAVIILIAIALGAYTTHLIAENAKYKTQIETLNSQLEYEQMLAEKLQEDLSFYNTIKVDGDKKVRDIRIKLDRALSKNRELLDKLNSESSTDSEKTQAIQNEIDLKINQLNEVTK